MFNIRERPISANQCIDQAQYSACFITKNQIKHLKRNYCYISGRRQEDVCFKKIRRAEVNKVKIFLSSPPAFHACKQKQHVHSVGFAGLMVMIKIYNTNIFSHRSCQNLVIDHFDTDWGHWVYPNLINQTDDVSRRIIKLFCAGPLCHMLPALARHGGLLAACCTRTAIVLVDRKDFIGVLLSQRGNSSADLMSQLNHLNPDCLLCFPISRFRGKGEKKNMGVKKSLNVIQKLTTAVL